MKNNGLIWLKLFLWILCLHSAILADYYEDDNYDAEDEEMSRVCPRGWKELGTKCYKYFVDPVLPWHRAEMFCRQQGRNGHLASLQSQTDVKKIFDLVYDTGHYLDHDYHMHSSTGSNLLWVGLTKWCPNRKQLRWSDGSIFNISLSRNVQAIESDQFKCLTYVVARSMETVFAPKNCSDYATFLCQLPKNNTNTLESTEYNDTGICESYEWCPYQSKCYKVQHSRMTWQDSEKSCQDEGGNLVSIHSKSEERFATNAMILGFSGGTSFWTGLNKLENSDASLKWSDQTPLDFYPSFVYDFNKYQYSSCVMYSVPNYRSVPLKAIMVMNGIMNSSWSLTRCDNKHMSICVKRSTNYTAENEGNTVDKIVGNCPDCWARFGIKSAKCYKAFGVNNQSEKASYLDANKKCKQYGANLVSISNIFENYFVLSLLNSTINSSWIGLYLTSGEQKVKWIDETSVKYTNFDTTSLESHGLEQKENDTITHKRLYEVPKDRCFFMSVRQSPGVWEPVVAMMDIQKKLQEHGRRKRAKNRGFSTYAMNQPRLSSFDYTRILNFCDTITQSFVCEKSVSPNNPAPKIDPLSCAPKDAINGTMYYRYAGNCYHFIRNGMAWLDAAAYCQTYNSSLVSIMNVFEYGFLSSIAKMESFEQFWIGLSEINEPGYFEWSDKWPVLYTRWGINEPRREKDSQCVKMRIQDNTVASYWLTESCQNIAPFICKTTTDLKPAGNQIEGTCDSDWLEGSTQCYKIVKNLLRANDAVFECLREFGSNAMLATFPTKEDLSFVIHRNEFLNAKRRFYIGLAQRPHGGYEWLTNHPLTYASWGADQPQYAWNPSQQVCVEMDQSGLWYDAGCYEYKYYICSKPKQTQLAPIIPSVALSSTTQSSTKPTINSTTMDPLLSSTIQISVKSYYSLPNRGKSTVTPLKSNSSQLKSEKSTNSSSSGVKVGIAFCVIFFAMLIGGIAAFVYRRKRAGQSIFGDMFGGGGNDQMRFEVLNETD